MTEPQASILASAGRGVPLPKMTSAAIIDTFHITGAVYESRKR